MSRTDLGLLLCCASAMVLSGCASMTVTKIESITDTAKGQRYYLPKPVIQVAPQEDGSIAVSVLYLPDTAQEYAIDASSWFSNYSLQVLPNPDGTLSGIYYQGDSTAIAQQAAQSAGAVATQAANYQLGQAQAQQTTVVAAQSAVDTAQATLDAANAALAADEASNAAAPDQTKLPVTPAALASDASTAAQAQAKLDVLKQALLRAQSQKLLPSTTLSAAGVATTAGALAPDAAFTGGTAATAPAAVALPGPHGAMLYALNDKLDGGAEKVTLTAVHSMIVGDAAATSSPGQDTYAVSFNAMGPPTLIAPTDPFSTADKAVRFQLSRPILGAANGRIVTGTPEKIALALGALPLSGDKQTITLDTSSLPAGKYKLVLSVSYSVSADGKDSRTSVASTAFELQ